MLDIIMLPLMIVLTISALIFWIRMIIDCAKRDFANQNEKIVWLIVICITQIIGALAYWFSVVKKENK